MAFCSIMRAKPPWLAVTARSTSARIWLRSASRSCLGLGSGVRLRLRLRVRVRVRARVGLG